MTDSPPIDDRQVDRRLGDLDNILNEHDFPSTSGELTDLFGSHLIQSQGGLVPFSEVLQNSTTEKYESSDEIKSTILKQLDRK